MQVNKIELENIYAFQAQGAYIRAKARYKIEGEKPSRLFCSLEKHNAVQKHIPKLIVEKNDKKVEITDQISIENEIYNYYKDLFAQRSTENYNIDNFVAPEISTSCPKLSEDQKNAMERIITPEELTKYLKKNEKQCLTRQFGIY